MSLRDVSEWAKQQAKRLATNFGLDGAADRDMFALAQTAKLGEEVGELHAEVLAAACCLWKSTVALRMSTSRPVGSGGRTSTGPTATV